MPGPPGRDALLPPRLQGWYLPPVQAACPIQTFGLIRDPVTGAYEPGGTAQGMKRPSDHLYRVFSLNDNERRILTGIRYPIVLNGIYFLTLPSNRLVAVKDISPYPRACGKAACCCSPAKELPPA